MYVLYVFLLYYRYNQASATTIRQNKHGMAAWHKHQQASTNPTSEIKHENIKMKSGIANMARRKAWRKIKQSSVSENNEMA